MGAPGHAPIRRRRLAGERFLPRSAAAPVYVAVATLRQLGLSALLESRDEGYLLDPGLALIYRT